MHIHVDNATCQGHGRCYDLARELFAPDDVGYAIVLETEVRPGLEEKALRAERSCPERAITIAEP